MKKIFYGFLLLSAVSCGSVQNYTKNDLKQNFFEEKMMTFNLNSASVQYINVTGPHMGTSSQPDVNEVFKLAIEELKKETKIDLKIANSISQANIEAQIVDINWKFGLSSAEMITIVNFNTNGKTFTSTGKFKNMGYGEASNILRKSLKNAIYNFLMEYQK
jgi:hypothetical protein